MYAPYGKQPEPSLLYGLVYARIFPPLWGTLAVLPPAAGILAAVLLRRRSGRAALRLA
jgi:hypothetical protein